MGREAILFLRAVQMLTRLPTPRFEDDPDALARSAKYFPLVGEIVGAISGLALILAAEIWSGILPALLAIGIGVAMTGAFHEDGLADTADGLGGGHTIEKRLAIMKDSRIGTYGALALGFCLAIKVAALASIHAPMEAALALLAAHGGGRCAAVTAMAFQNYAGEPKAAKLKPAQRRVSKGELMLAIVFAAWPLILMRPVAALAAVLVGGAAAFWLARKAGKLIGGYTGDSLGAVEQLFETGFLLAASAILLAR